MNIKEIEGSTIFAVDDNKENLEVLIEYLKNFKFNIVPLRSGEEILSLIQNRIPDIILLDIMMPGGIDGYETCRRLKINDATKDIPVIFMSALTDTFDKVTGFNLGAVDYITKPIETEELLSRIHTHLSISRLQKELFEINTKLEEKVLTRTEELRKSNIQLRKEITIRKKSEEALHQYEHIVSSSTDMLALLDNQFNYLAANKAYLNTFKLTPEQLIGNTVAKVFGEEYFNSDIKPNAVRCLGGEEVSYQDWFEFPVYGRRYMDITYYPYYSEDNKIMGFVMDGRNITERKLADEALLESEEKYRTLVESLEEGIASVDENETFVYVNKAAADIFGYSQDEMIGKNLKELTTPEMFKQILNETLLRKKGKSNQYELSILRKNREERIITVTSTPNISENGEHHGSRGIFHDITERRQAEEQIKKDLEEKRVLLQELYHRTKNNMQVVSSMLKIQLRNIENRDLTGSTGIEYMHDSFNEIINKIKAMSLVHEKLYQAKDLSHINLKEYIEDLVRYLMRGYNIRSEKVILKMELEDVFVLIDSAIPLGLVLNEMISNVFKHAFPHTKNDELFIKLFKEEDETINIHLNDNGVGIPNDFDLRNVNTIGLQTVFSLTEYQLMGKVKYDTKKGLKWHIKFKDDQHKERV